MLLYVRFGLWYFTLWASDKLDRYKTKLILALPPHVYKDSIYRIKQVVSYETDSSSDCDTESFCNESCSIESSSGCWDSRESECSPLQDVYDVYITQLLFQFRDPATKERTVRRMHGGQLRTFIDDGGKFYLGTIGDFYPDLELITIKYFKVDVSDNGTGAFIMQCKKLNVRKKIDMYNNTSCSLGVVL